MYYIPFIIAPVPFDNFFFDLDDTIYPPVSGLWELIGKRINQYMVERLGYPSESVVKTREKYFKEYGTTLRGLQANHPVDTLDYLAFVHDVPLSEYIQPDRDLRRVIQHIQGRKFIFTNADANHANRVLKRVGLQGLFDGIIDVHVIAPFCKPMPESFALALRAAGDPDPMTCMLLDDQARITRAARERGIFTVLVNHPGSSSDADATLEKLSDLPSILPPPSLATY
jgi:putative hydrolase of the HAD superfamily